MPVSPSHVSREVSGDHDPPVWEFVGLLPIMVLVIAVVWQLGLWGVAATYTSHAADVAAHSAGLGGSTDEVHEIALQAVPRWFRHGVQVVQTADGTMRVTGSLPVIVPTLTIDGLTLSSEAPIVAEES